MLAIFENMMYIKIIEIMENMENMENMDNMELMETMAAKLKGEVHHESSKNYKQRHGKFTG